MTADPDVPVRAGGAMDRRRFVAIWAGAAGTMWLVDASRRFNFVFMSQFTRPTSYPVGNEADVAIETDRASF
jgi:hypothetical protein